MALSKTNVKNLLKDTLVKFYTDVFKPDLDNHTHNYAGSSTPGGAATSANKLANARKIGGANFDGTTNITAKDILDTVVTNTTGSANSNKFTKFASIDVSSGTYISCSGHFIFTNNEAANNFAGILYYYFRSNQNTDTVQILLQWETLINTDYYNCVYAVKTASGKYDLYLKQTGEWQTELVTNISANNPQFIKMYKLQDYVSSINPVATSTMTKHALENHTHANLVIQGNGTQINTYNGGTAKTINITPSNIGAATSGHTHNYAGSSSAGGTATEAAKTTGTLTIQGNGTAINTFNGSANKTINITPSNIGAATSGHTHNYAGSSSAGGAATSANKVNSSLTIQGNGTALATFDGSSAKTVNITPANIGAATSGHTHSNYATTSHSHGLLNNNFAKELSNTTTDSGWSMINSTYQGFLLTSLRSNASAPNWMLPNYASGIVFGGSDTKGVMSVSYSEPKVRFAGGAGTGPSWYYTLTGSKSKEYNLESFATTTYVDTQLGDITSILEEINGE